MKLFKTKAKKEDLAFIRETLRKQLELLSKCSESYSNSDPELMHLSEAVVMASRLLSEL